MIEIRTRMIPSRRSRFIRHILLVNEGTGIVRWQGIARRTTKTPDESGHDAISAGARFGFGHTERCDEHCISSLKHEAVTWCLCQCHDEPVY